ncbi:hypothetical protein E2562_034980 [Oryza meyeriana var. granulata]|uniref:Uncharacterized protein n=1 Tax=Oryza meyeriana var. granulata TaxID=110450 RepID=A0A6G1FFE3_9ORYZ|nr:hypothetical protein E2562_034980 [Oryza meyeriana var. granulata]KAF0935591.1 hypothetical protein E2562_034980 [Oryza meyeriana var. granulata]
MEKKAGDSIPRQIARTSSSSRCGTDTESPSVYLVVGHGVTRPAYSVFKVPAGGGGGDSDSDDDTPVPLPPHPARLASKHCMCFVPVQSRHGPWIVGVGGNSARDYGPETIVFDTKTCKAIPGPKLLSTKLCPVLLTFGERIYALATMPAVTGDVNFVPWFEVTVKSHVAVGSYILLSITGQTGTHMFDVETEQWAKLDDKDLPFIGPAIPQGTLFLGLSNATEELTAYKINVCASAVASPSAITAGCLSLSIVEIQIVTNEAEEEIVSTGRFISLNYPAGNPGFCSFKWCNDDPLEFRISSLPQHVRELVTITAYSTVDYLESTRTLVISTQWKQVYSIYDPLRRLSSPCLQGIISF